MIYLLAYLSNMPFKAIQFLSECLEDAKLLARVNLKRNLEKKVSKASKPMEIRRMPVRDLEEIQEAARKVTQGIYDS